MSKAKGNGSPFASLEAMLASLPEGVKPSPVEKSAQKLLERSPARAVVRMERKGRGGKEATVIEKLGLAPAQLEIWCRELKQALGCGGTIDGDTIVLQGDLRPRLPAVLEARGVGRVTVG